MPIYNIRYKGKNADNPASFEIKYIFIRKYSLIIKKK